MPKFARIGALILAVMMIVFAAGCSQPGVANRKVGTVLPVGEDDFTREAVRIAENEMQKLAEERAFPSTLMKAATANEQVNYINNFIKDTLTAINPDNSQKSEEDKKKTPYGLIVLWPMDAETLKPAVDEARKVGVPVLLFGEAIPGFEPTSSVMVDTEATAQMALSHIEKNAEGLSNVAVLESAKLQPPFAASFRRICDKAAEPLVCPDGNLREFGQSAMDALLSANPDGVQAVFADDDELALGALDAVKAHPGCGVKVIASVGGTKALLDAMADAPVELVTYAYSPTMYKMVMQLAADVSTGVSILPEYRLITTQVTKSYEKQYRQSEEYIARYGG